MIKFTRQSIFQHILEIPLQQSACSAKSLGSDVGVREIFGHDHFDQE
jgi:hypothetical protein